MKGDLHYTVITNPATVYKDGACQVFVTHSDQPGRTFDKINLLFIHFPERCCHDDTKSPF